MFDKSKNPQEMLYTKNTIDKKYKNNIGDYTYGKPRILDWNEGAKLIIENDVWLGFNATILSGVTIGDGAVIGANSLVTRSVKAYEIVGGNPAKYIKKKI